MKHFALPKNFGLATPLPPAVTGLYKKQKNGINPWKKN